MARCDKCKYWTPDSNNVHYLPKDHSGTCRGLNDYTNVDITVDAGWEGGVVGDINTRCSFYCANFKEK